MLRLQQEALEFGREATDLLQWISEKRAQAQSDDYGQDFEHLALINAKFQALRDEVRSCEEARVASVRRLSANLLAAKSPEAKAIRRRLDEVKAARELLEEALQTRELTLASAAEIHCFNKDVQDLLRRIGDKEAAFAGAQRQLARDVASCEGLRRQHEIFVEELTALKAQLQELNAQSEALRQKHPGDTAESVAAETDELIERFRGLWLAAERRVVDLGLASEHFRFLACVRDVAAWIEATGRQMRELPGSQR